MSEGRVPLGTGHSALVILAAMTAPRLPPVGFDGLFLEQPMTGSGQYATHLWRELRARAECVDARLLFPADAPESVRSQSGASAPAVPPPAGVRGKARKIWWEQR